MICTLFIHVILSLSLSLSPSLLSLGVAVDFSAKCLMHTHMINNIFLSSSPYLYVHISLTLSPLLSLSLSVFISISPSIYLSLSFPPIDPQFVYRGAHHESYDPLPNVGDTVMIELDLSDPNRYMHVFVNNTQLKPFYKDLPPEVKIVVSMYNQADTVEFISHATPSIPFYLSLPDEIEQPYPY